MADTGFRPGDDGRDCASVNLQPDDARQYSRGKVDRLQQLGQIMGPNLIAERVGRLEITRSCCAVPVRTRHVWRALEKRAQHPPLGRGVSAIGGPSPTIS